MRNDIEIRDQGLRCAMNYPEEITTDPPQNVKESRGSSLNP